MTFTLKINARNDIHLPADLLRYLNLGEDRILKVEVQDNKVVLVPVDLEARYSTEEMKGLEHLHEDEKEHGWISLDKPEDVDRLIK